MGGLKLSFLLGSFGIGLKGRGGRGGADAAADRDGGGGGGGDDVVLPGEDGRGGLRIKDLSSFSLNNFALAGRLAIIFVLFLASKESVFLI